MTETCLFRHVSFVGPGRGQAAARISQTRISAGRSAVTRWPPAAVKRTASPVVQRAGALEVYPAAGDEQVDERASGRSTRCPACSRAACSAAYRLPDADRRGAVVPVHPGRHRTRPPRSSSSSISSCS